MSIHKELAFENDICNHLAANGWLYQQGDTAHYHRELALFPADALDWLKDTQLPQWQLLTAHYGSEARATETVLARLRTELNQKGTLDVLRDGIDVLGAKKRLTFAEWKPAMGLNPDIIERYAANRLRVVRQVRYSLHNENSIDLVLFLNGIPVATAELKTDFTQSIDDAIAQYKNDRQPKPKGKSAEPLLSFISGALVHFAVSNQVVFMTTKLDGPATSFLPFNKGNPETGAAGNPANPHGHATAYLWEQVWAKESWLEIIGRYVIAQKSDKGERIGTIFPRYHQLDATRALSAAVLRDGVGGKYLIQHSAGSGKTNSIAWTAHLLAELHDASDNKLFDTVLVVSDRNVIDKQLQDALFGFQRMAGVVATITHEQGSKSGQLAKALGGDKKIVVCTMQTFPFALEAVRELGAREGKRFAVIADEAHSSQSGHAVTGLKQVLSAQESAELDDGGEVSTEDILAAQMATKAQGGPNSGDGNVTFIAFTATPKAKTLELFGTRPNPALPAGPGNLPAPFHVYSMRQAIEEGFILDVLRNYVTYSLAFRLAAGAEASANSNLKSGPTDDTNDSDDQVDRNAANKRIMGWVKLHPHNISQKVQIIVEHYKDHVAPLLGGKAKAMVVVGSRKEAVRWQLAIANYIKSKGYKFGTLVAFSGEVSDPESGSEAFSETSATLNPGLRGRDIRKAFDTDEYQILLVANKFQTGFDQKLLCGMYVDKRLAGIQAVQTLSRLNRAAPGKDTTFVVDFANEADEVLAAFKLYYETAELTAVTDPNLVYQLRNKLDGAGHYDEYEVERVVTAVLEGKTQAALVAPLQPVVDRLLFRFGEAKRAFEAARDAHDEAAMAAATETMDTLSLFKADVTAYLRLYTFLSQMYDYGDTVFEKRAIFFKHLLPQLEFGRERETIDVSRLVLTHHQLRNRGKAAMNLAAGQSPGLDPLREVGTGAVRNRDKASLDEIIAQLNELFGQDIDDALIYFEHVRGHLLRSPVLQTQAANNTKEQFAKSPDLDTEATNAVIDAMDAHAKMSEQMLNSKDTFAKLIALLIQKGGLYEALRVIGATGPGAGI